MNYKIDDNGVPVVLDNAIAYLVAKVIKEVDVGTYTIFIGKVVEAEILSNEEPMTYAYYHEAKQGKTPKTAPTYMEEESKEGVGNMVKYRCKVCGYVYDPEKGDPDSGIKPETPFEELPEDWLCPICGASKEEFEKVE